MMFRTLWCLFVSLILCSTARGGFWKFHDEFKGRTDVQYREIVEVIFDYFQNENEIPDKAVRRNLLAYYKTLLEPAAVEIHFQSERASAGTKSVVGRGVVYFAKGEIVVQFTDCNDKYEKNAMNYVTIDGNLYEWQFGKKTGRKLQRYHGDTVELLDYILDPALLKRFMYTEFENAPAKWDKSKEDREIVLFPRSRDEIKDAGLVSVSIANDPFWLRSLTYTKLADPNYGQITVTVESPRIQTAIPSGLQTLPDGIDFKESNATVESRLGTGEPVMKGIKGKGIKGERNQRGQVSLI